MLRASYWVLSKKHIIQNTITTTIFINYSTKAFRSKANNKHRLKHTKWKQQPIIFIQKNILYTNMVKTRSNLNTSTSLALKRSKRTITTATKKPINKRKKKSSVIKNNKVTRKKKALIKSISTVVSSNNDDNNNPTTPKRKKKKKKKSSSSMPTYAVSPGPTGKPPKHDWREVYDILVELRKDRTAPVDWAGSEALPENGPHHSFQTLIALMLSSQTKDQMVSTVMKRLQKHGLTVDNIAKTSDKKLYELIYGVGFHNKKVIYIRKTVQQIQDKFDGKVPSNLKDLISFPGVGPKMGIIIMNVAFNKHVGISVDTHVHRICQELGWVKKVKKPEDTRRQMETWLPKEEWGNINLLLVGVGQEVQQERQKLLKKCLQLKPKTKQEKAIKIIKKLGVNVKKEMEILENSKKKEGSSSSSK